MGPNVTMFGLHRTSPPTGKGTQLAEGRVTSFKHLHHARPLHEVWMSRGVQSERYLHRSSEHLDPHLEAVYWFGQLCQRCVQFWFQKFVLLCPWQHVLDGSQFS